MKLDILQWFARNSNWARHVNDGTEQVHHQPSTGDLAVQQLYKNEGK